MRADMTPAAWHTVGWITPISFRPQIIPAAFHEDGTIASGSRVTQPKPFSLRRRPVGLQSTA